MTKQEKIEQLLQKYLSGETSHREEARLRHYFSNPTRIVPEEWEPFKALFTYEARLQKRTIHFPHAIAAAAVAVLCIGISWKLMSHTGNYVVIDGQRYTSATMVHSEAEDMFSLIMTTEDNDFEALSTF